MDKFYEQFITKDYGILPKVFDFIFYLFLLLIAISIPLFIFLGSISIYILIFSIIFSILIKIIGFNLFLEYEYEYFEGEITISKIINKKTRRIIATLNTEQISKASYVSQQNNQNSIKCCIKNIPNNKEILIFVNSNDKSSTYYMSLDEKFLDILKRDKPHIFNYI